MYPLASYPSAHFHIFQHFTQAKKLNGGIEVNGLGGEAPKGPGLADVEDLTRLNAALTEDLVLKTLQARFYHQKYQVGLGSLFVLLIPPSGEVL